jgi:hypothetical protein
MSRLETGGCCQTDRLMKLFMAALCSHFLRHSVSVVSWACPYRSTPQATRNGRYQSASAASGSSPIPAYSPRAGPSRLPQCQMQLSVQRRAIFGKHH